MRETRFTIFHKIVLSIFLLLIPIVILYSYSNSVSESVVRNEIGSSLVSRLAFLQTRLNTQVVHMSRSAIQLSDDPSLSSINSLESFKSYFNVIQFKSELESRIAVQSNTMEWANEISIYFPPSKQVIAPAAGFVYDENDLVQHVDNRWKAWKRPEQKGGGYEFYYYAVNPYSTYASPLKADNIVEIRFSDSSLIRMLDEYKETGTSDPFLFHAQDGVIFNSTANEKLIANVREALAGRPVRQQDSFQVDIGGEAYLVNSIASPALGWTLADYVPMQQVLMPISKSNTLFYLSTSLLLLLGIVAAFLLYRNVQIPVRQLLRSLQKVKRGDFSARIDARSRSEFQFVFQRFNEMTAQIGDLIENVYRAQLTASDAQLKQLQSQINPHFLYNCLYFIVNMVRLGNDDAAEKMAINLGDYFKYTTRLEKQDATVEEEMDLIRSYLEIQNLRMNRIKFAIGLPAGMGELEIPRLLLQPVVENAVIHGIEPKLGGGEIRITGSLNDRYAEIIVEDSGVGITEDKREELTRRLAEPVTSGSGYGIWNVNQRLLLKFGEGSGIRYEHAESGGLRVRLIWNI